MNTMQEAGYHNYRLDKLESEIEELQKRLRLSEQEKEGLQEKACEALEEDKSQMLHKRFKTCNEEEKDHMLESAFKRLCGLKSTFPRLADSGNPELRRFGAVMMIQLQTREAKEAGIEVGDFVEILAQPTFYRVKSLRNGREADLPWKAFLPSVAGEDFPGAQRSGQTAKNSSTKRVSEPRAAFVTIPPQRRTPKVYNPATPEGQQIGAVLMIIKMRESVLNDTWLRVGDCVEVTAHQSLGCMVKSLRLNTKLFVPWDCFFPVGYGGKCECFKTIKYHPKRTACHCEYINPADRDA